MNNLREKLELKRKELNIQHNSPDKLHYLRKIEEKIASFKEASIKKQNNINYKFPKKKHKTAIGTQFIESENFLKESLFCFERKYIKEKNEKQRLKDKEFRVIKLKELRGKGINSQKLSILVEYANENIEWSLLIEFITQLLKKPLNTLKKYFYSIQRSEKLLLGSIALEENRVLLN